ncbi:MAG: hypothetical protein WBP29_05275 [Candidatus Zixiibacteriota bacterium]
MIMKLWSKKSQENPVITTMARKPAAGKVPPPLRAKPRLKSLNLDFDRQISISPTDTGRARLELYRYLRDSIPVLNAVIWTWVRLCSAKFDFQITGAESTAEEKSIREILLRLDQRIYRNGLLKRGGFRELLLQFFESLFTDGAVCGELQLSASGRSVDRFLLADMRSIVIEPQGDDYRLLQEIEDHRTLLNPEATFYYGLGAQPGSVTGRSLLAAIPFVSRVEQTLVSDMYRSMRSAGYHRIHVKITPPEKRSDETDSDYFTRANNYFDDTVGMMRDFGPDKNPVTWDDVAIEYIGPSNRSSSATAWYMNHKSMIEDICAGTHLAPFMLGYAYGTTHNWAEFKYELVQRQVATVQNAAISLLNWVANVELALNGVTAEVQFRFENRAHIGLTERAQAEKIQLDNIITKMNNNLISREEAINELARIL